jgi:hypothetical protein
VVVVAADGTATVSFLRFFESDEEEAIFATGGCGLERISLDVTGVPLAG